MAVCSAVAAALAPIVLHDFCSGEQPVRIGMPSNADVAAACLPASCRLQMDTMQFEK